MFLEILWVSLLHPDLYHIFEVRRSVSVDSICYQYIATSLMVRSSVLIELYISPGPWKNSPGKGIQAYSQPSSTVWNSNNIKITQ